MRFRLGWRSAIVLAVPFLGPPAAAQSPVAIVEEVAGPPAGVEFMDYLFPGQVVRLDRGGRIVVSYLASCWREEIAGGTLTVGQEQSEVTGGEVRRSKVQCAGGRMQLSGEQAKQSGGMTFRAPPRREPAKAAAVALVVYGTSPVFELERAGRLVIERLDKPGEAIEREVAPGQLLRGAFLDLARSGSALVAGGTYRVRHEGRAVVFRVAPEAAPGAAPVAARLVRFPKS